MPTLPVTAIMVSSATMYTIMRMMDGEKITFTMSTETQATVLTAEEWAALRKAFITKDVWHAV